jgi:hypothetical protein
MSPNAAMSEPKWPAVKIADARNVYRPKMYVQNSIAELKGYNAKCSSRVTRHVFQQYCVEEAACKLGLGLLALQTADGDGGTEDG